MTVRKLQIFDILIIVGDFLCIKQCILGYDKTYIHINSLKASVLFKIFLNLIFIYEEEYWSPEDSP